MRDAVICEPVRTAVGAFGGSLRDEPAHVLATTVIRAVLERTGLPADAVDDVVLGHCYPTVTARVRAVMEDQVMFGVGVTEVEADDDEPEEKPTKEKE